MLLKHKKDFTKGDLVEDKNVKDNSQINLQGYSSYLISNLSNQDII